MTWVHFHFSWTIPLNRWLFFSVLCLQLLSLYIFVKESKQTCSVCSRLRHAHQSMLVFLCTPSFIIVDIWLCSLYLPLIWKEHIFPIRNPVVTFAFEGWWYFLSQTASLCVSFPGCVPSSPPSISSSPFCTALSFSLNMDVIGGTEGSSDALPLENTPFSFLLPAVRGFIFYIPTSSALTTPTLRSPYLSMPPSHIAVFLFTFLFSASATMAKDNISTANPASFPLYYHADRFVCTCTSDVAHAYMYIWPQLNNANACEQKSFF